MDAKAEVFAALEIHALDAATREQMVVATTTASLTPLATCNKHATTLPACQKGTSGKMAEAGQHG